VSDELAEALVTAMEQLDPILEAAKGLRAKLLADDWSPYEAESCAAEWLRGAIAATWRATA
jgi:hypothetical protein